MSIVILSYQSMKDTPYHEWIPERIHEVILVCNSEVADSYPESIYNKVVIDNYNYNNNLEKLIIDIHRENPIETIIALDEFDIERAGRLRTHLGIKGQDEESALLYRDKFLMKSKLDKNGVEVAKFQALNSVIDLLSFIEEFGYPIVVKPRSLAGSLGVTIINNSKELENLLFNGIPNNSMVEKYIDGEMYHIDGLIINSEISFIQPSKYRSTCLDWSLGGFTASYLLEKKNPLFESLSSFVKEAIEKLSLPHNTPFHAEVFVTKEGGLVFNEVGSRVPGGRSNYEIFYGTGINFNKVTVRNQCGIKEQICYNQKYLTGHIYIPPKNGTLIDIPSEIKDEGVLEYLPYLENKGKTFSYAKSSVDCIATIICKADNEIQMINTIDRIYNSINNQLVWLESNKNLNLIKQ